MEDLWHLLLGVLYVAIGAAVAVAIMGVLWMAFLGFQVIYTLKSRSTDEPTRR